MHTFRGLTVHLDRFAHDHLSLARWLLADGAQVHAVDVDPLPASHAAEWADLATRGAVLHPATDPDTLHLQADAIFADLFHAPLRRFIVEAWARGALVSNLADLVLQRSPVPVIGVTGSAGKSSTTAMVEAMLHAAGRPLYVGHDNPVLENRWPNYELLAALPTMQPPGMVLTELTSGHLEYAHASPQVAVVTVLWPDHVDWHGSASRYFDAKANIVRFQTSDDWAVLNAADALIDRHFRPLVRGQVAEFNTRSPVAQGVYLRGERVTARWDGRETDLLPVDAIPVARPYLGNALAAATTALVAAVPLEVIADTLAHPNGLQHRLERLGELNGVAVFADGMAITPAKASAAISWFAPGKLVLIAGGSVDSDFSDALHISPEEQAMVAEACAAAAHTAHSVVLFGSAAPVLRQHLLAAGMAPRAIVDANDLPEAAAQAMALARPGDSVLFAPIYFVFPHTLHRFNEAIAALTGP